jgi:starch phosphorylase
MLTPFSYLAIVGSFKVNGVAELHSQLLQSTIFRDFVEFKGRDHFSNVTNGITPRRYVKPVYDGGPNMFAYSET